MTRKLLPFTPRLRRYSLALLAGGLVAVAVAATALPNSAPAAVAGGERGFTVIGDPAGGAGTLIVYGSEVLPNLNTIVSLLGACESEDFCSDCTNECAKACEGCLTRGCHCDLEECTCASSCMGCVIDVQRFQTSID